MILDTSAIVAIFLEEPEAARLIDIVGAADPLGIGGPTLAEAAIVLEARLGRDPRTLLARFLDEARAIVVPFGDAHWKEALSAWERFGRGRHPARLNFGDCLSYAVARLANRPLLCVGKDFAKTDLILAYGMR